MKLFAAILALMVGFTGATYAQDDMGDSPDEIFEEDMGQPAADAAPAETKPVAEEPKAEKKAEKKAEMKAEKKAKKAEKVAKKKGKAHGKKKKEKKS